MTALRWPFRTPLHARWAAIYWYGLNDDRSWPAGRPFVADAVPIIVGRLVVWGENYFYKIWSENWNEIRNAEIIE